jgi:uncharacterized protein YgiM (DUF1202 family)
MERDKIRYTVITFLVFVSFLFVINCQANTDDIRWVTADVGLNMRAAPDLKAEKIGLIPYGEKVKLIEETGDRITISGATGKWSKVQWKGKTGWVFGGFLIGESSGITPADWKVYKNSKFGYRFSYPPEAAIEEWPVDGFNLDELPEGKTRSQYMAELQEEYGTTLCVSIGYKLGYIVISAPPNVEHGYVTCGPTGIGMGKITKKREAVLIDGVFYTAEGMDHMGGDRALAPEEYDLLGTEIPCDTLSCHNQLMVLSLEDGTRIFYGSTLDEHATYDEYLTTTRKILLHIVASFIPGA